jgi:hypothetical protein
MNAQTQARSRAGLGWGVVIGSLGGLIGLGGLMLGLTPSAWLLTGLGLILLVSAVKVFQHTQERKRP